MTGDSGPAVRATVRAMVLDRDERVLLQAYLDPTVHGHDRAPHTTPVWIAPGGGLRPGEDAAAGLARELAEETGLVDLAWGAWLWSRSVDLRYQGRWRRFEERYRLGRVAAARPAVAPAALEEHERSVLLGHRWWTLDDLLATRETIYPPRLAQRLAAVLGADPPAEAIDISADG